MQNHEFSSQADQNLNALQFQGKIPQNSCSGEQIKYGYLKMIYASSLFPPCMSLGVV